MCSESVPKVSPGNLMPYWLLCSKVIPPGDLQTTVPKLNSFYSTFKRKTSNPITHITYCTNMHHMLHELFIYQLTPTTRVFYLGVFLYEPSCRKVRFNYQEVVKESRNLKASMNRRGNLTQPTLKGNYLS